VSNGGLDIIVRTILETPCNQHPSKRPWILTICFSGVYEHNFQIYWFYHRAYVGICGDVARPIQIEEPPVSFQAMMDIKFFDCTLDRMKLTSLEGNPWTLAMAVSVAFFWHFVLVPHYAASKNRSIRSVAL